ncbi:MAG TPA: histidinol-phosphatase HisJ family protein [Lachnospiraceae bacterium]|nr:histidinol-phosphatase HisJ family protein [Lachnospiraceae bacterium]
MAITADYHLHSSYSGDSTEPMENMIQAAIKKGLTHICFTEHMDIDFPISMDAPEGTFLLNTDSYLYDLALLKTKYENQIKIFFGVELGLQPHLHRQLSLYSRSHEFDFIIGSTHIVNGKDPYYKSYYEGRSEEEAYREYFQGIIDNINKFQNFDVCGHLDYVVRYGINKDKDYSYTKYKDLFDKILTLLLELEKGIEINTGSLLDGNRDVSPCTDVIKRYKELGGEIITVGSDAHLKANIGSQFNRAEEILKACGFKYYCIFENRLPEYKKLI